MYHIPAELPFCILRWWLGTPIFPTPTSSASSWMQHPSQFYSLHSLCVQGWNAETTKQVKMSWGNPCPSGSLSLSFYSPLSLESHTTFFLSLSLPTSPSLVIKRSKTQRNLASIPPRKREDNGGRRGSHTKLLRCCALHNGRTNSWLFFCETQHFFPLP